MNRNKDISSVFGDTQRTSLEYAKLLAKEFKNYSVLVVDDKDCHHSIMFAKKGANNVTVYESDKRYIEDGTIGSYTLTRVENRKNYNIYKNKINIIIDNFYTSKFDYTYEFTYCFRSLHLNSSIPMEKKMKKLMSSVKPGGYLYYYKAINDKDYINYPKNKYIRNGEMLKYFNKDNWDILNIKEDDRFTEHLPHTGNEEKHYHKIGRVFAKKKNNRLTHKYHYNILLNTTFGS